MQKRAWWRAALAVVTVVVTMMVGMPSASAAGGDVDTTWSGDGILPFASRFHIALGPYGGAGATYVGSWKQTDGSGPMRISKFTAAGDPAAGWGSAGYVLRAFYPGGNGVSFPTQVIPVGLRITVVGEHYGSTARLGVARLRSDGSYDTAFSGDGRALYKVFGSEHDVVSAFRAEVLTGGKIGLAVVALDDVNGQLQFREQAMVRLNANGTLDTTFSGDGVAVVPNNWSDIRWRPDGSSFVGVQGSSTHQVRKLRPSGQLDGSFSGDGIASAACGSHLGANIGIDSSGRPVLQCVKITGADLTMAMYRFTTSGGFDTTYSGDAKTSWVIPGGASNQWSTYFDTTGKPWVAVGVSGDPQAVHIYTLDGTGAPDAAWGTNGQAALNLSVDLELGLLSRGGNRLFLTTFQSDVTVHINALVI